MCLILLIENLNFIVNELRYNVFKMFRLILDEICMQELNQIILRFYEGLNKKNFLFLFFIKILIIIS